MDDTLTQGRHDQSGSIVKAFRRPDIAEKHDGRTDLQMQYGQQQCGQIYALEELARKLVATGSSVHRFPPCQQNKTDIPGACLRHMSTVTVRILPTESSLPYMYAHLTGCRATSPRILKHLAKSVAYRSRVSTFVKA